MLLKQQKIRNNEDFYAKSTIEDFKIMCAKFQPKNIALFSVQQALLHQKAPRGRRYTETMKELGLSVFFRSPSAYRFTKTFFQLPSLRTLRRMTEKWKFHVGIVKNLFKALEMKMSSLKEHEKVCFLIADEMSLKTHLFYNISADEIIGFHDTGITRNTDAANNVLVIMARGVYSPWKQPLAYYFLHSTCPPKEFNKIINDIVTNLTNIGANVIGLTTDMGSDFTSFCRYKKVSKETPFFYVGDKKLYYLHDVPHLLKAIRNNLMEKDFLDEDGNPIHWSYIVDLYNVCKDHDFQLAPKLKEIHIEPKNFDKMKVKYAAQVFSATVAAAIKTLVALHVLPHEAIYTAHFIEKINNLFDILNSSTVATAYRASEDQVNTLQKGLILFDCLRVIQTKKNYKDVTNTMKFIKGWQMTIKGVIMLFNDLNRDFLFTRRLNQDCLENFFGSLRNKNGNVKNPTPIQFIKAYKKLFCLKYVMSSDGSNCADDFDTFFAKMTEFSENAANTSGEREHIFDSTTPDVLFIGKVDYYNLTLPEENGFRYVCGYLLKKCFKIHSCPTCKMYAYSNLFYTQETMYITHKSFGDPSEVDSGLCNPPQQFIDYIRNLESEIQTNMQKYSLLKGVGFRFKQDIDAISFQHPCELFPVTYLKKLFIRMRIFYILKFTNRKFKSLLSKDRKLFIVKNL